MKSVIILALLLITVCSKCSHKKKASFRAKSRHSMSHKKFINHKAKALTAKPSLFRRMAKKVKPVLAKPTDLLLMKKQMIKARQRRMKKQAPPAEAEKAKEGEAPAGAAPAEAPPALIREGWLKIHAESLLDEETYPELLQPKTEFQRKEKKLKIEVAEEENNLRKNPKNNDLHYFRLSKENLWYTET